MPPGGAMGNPGPLKGIDCAVAGVTLDVKARRTMAVVDVGVRVRGVKGGACVLRPDAVQITTAKSAGVSRPLSVTIADGQVSRPMAVLDSPGGERLRPWSVNLQKDEEHTVIFRFFTEGDISATGEVDYPARVRVDMRALGARVVNGASLVSRVALEPGSKGRVTLNMGNPKAPGTPRPTQPDGSLVVNQTLSKEDLLPLLDWRYEGDLPAAADASKLPGGGLAAFEFVRDGLVRQLVTSYTTEPKDEKKDDREKRQKAAFDAAFEAALAGARSNDAVVAGFSLRTVAWLASGLSPSAVDVKAQDGAGDGVALPTKVFDEVSKAGNAFGGTTGQKAAPSPAATRSIRGLLAKMGEPGSHKKEAEDALKRLSKKLDDGSLGPAAGTVLNAAATLPLPPAPNMKNARLITWGNKGAKFEGEGSGAAAMPKSGMMHRLVHRMSHITHVSLRATVVMLVAALAGFGIYLWFRNRAQTEPKPGLL